MYEAADVNEAVLTAAEKGVLTLVSQSMTNREIASSLKISAATVKRHLENILRKLRAGNRVEAAIRSLRCCTNHPSHIGLRSNIRPSVFLITSFLAADVRENHPSRAKPSNTQPSGIEKEQEQ